MTNQTQNNKQIEYAPIGFLALDPQAFGVAFEISAPKPRHEINDRCGTMRVVGPLAYSDSLHTTYDDVIGSFSALLENDIDVAIIDFSSPGGAVDGMLDTARKLRAMAQARGVKLVAFSASSMHSAAYGLALAADEIVISEMASAGSIGVLNTRLDVTKMQEMSGVRIELIASGARKADNDPSKPLTDPVREALQSKVDELAGIFFSWAAERRPGLKDPAALEANTFIGESARAAGLVDRVESYDSLVARYRNGTTNDNETSQEPPMPDPKKDDKQDAKSENEKDDMRSALAKAAESDDEEKAKRAKRALAAYDAEDKKEDEAKAEEEEKKEEDDAKSAKSSDAMAAFSAATSATLAELKAWKAETEQKQVAQQRTSFFASYDLSSAQLKALEGVSIEVAKAILESNGIKPRSGSMPAVSLPSGTIGENQSAAGDSPYVMRPNPELDAAMGLIKYAPTVKESPYRLTMGVIAPVSQTTAKEAK